MINVCTRSPWRYFIPAISMPKHLLRFHVVICLIGTMCFVVSTILFALHADNRLMPLLNFAGLVIVTGYFFASITTVRYRQTASTDVHVEMPKYLFAAGLINGLAAANFLGIWQL